MSERVSPSEILLMCPVGILISSQLQPSASLRRLISPEDRRLKDGLRPVHVLPESVECKQITCTYKYIYIYMYTAVCV